MRFNNKTIMLMSNTAWSLANFRSGLMCALRDDGARVIAVAPPDDYVSQIEALGIQFIPMPMDNKGTNPLKDILLLVRIRKLLTRIQPDVLINYTIKPVIYGALAASSSGVKVVSVVPGLGNVFLKRNFLTRFVELLYRISQRNVHTVFFLNNDDYALFKERKLVPLPKMAVLPGEGIDLKHFSPMVVSKPSDAPIRFLLMVRLLWDKGVGEFVEAAEVIRKDYPKTEFALLGFLDVQNPSAISRKQIDDWVARGKVNYFGVTADVRPYINDADVIVLPSYREGLSRSLLEAAAMGKPIVTSDITGCRDVIDDGTTGFLCKPKDSASLMQQMKRMLALTQQQRQAMGEAAREKMASQFDEALVIDRYRETLEAIFA